LTTRSSDADTGICEGKISQMLDLVLEAHLATGSRANGLVGAGHLAVSTP